MKLKKRKKSGRMRASRMHGYAAKKHRGKGHRGGKGMSGTGKKAGQKKTYVEKYLHPYFGKSGFTSRPTFSKKEDKINLEYIEKNLSSLIAQGIAKKTANGYEINLENYKILGEGEIKEKLIIKARACSEQAKKKVEKAGGKIVAKEKKEIVKVENKTEEKAKK